MSTTYFIAYSHEQGFGNADFKVDNKIASIDDIRSLEESIKEASNAQKIVILSWQELERFSG